MVEKEPTQQTRPKKGESVEIPVPTREQVFRDLDKATRPVEKAKRSRRRRRLAQ